MGAVRGRARGKAGFRQAEVPGSSGGPGAVGARREQRKQLGSTHLAGGGMKGEGEWAWVAH